MFGRFRVRRRRESAWGAAVFGCILIVASFPVLFLNEGRAVKTARALKEGASSVVSVDASRVDPANEGKFIHISGEARTNETLADPQFGVRVDAIRLTRNVEMYQWRQNEEEMTRKTDAGETVKETTYRYERVWSAQHLKSDDFHDGVGHQNPPKIPFATRSVQATQVEVGEYKLTTQLIDRIEQPEPLLVDLIDVPSDLAAKLRPINETATGAGGFYCSANSETGPGGKASGPAQEPQIGDTRIHFVVTHPTQVSIMAQQADNSFQPFETRAGRKLEMLSLGIVSADEMIHHAEAQNAFLTWALRVLGAFIMILGIGLVMQPLASITEWIPMLGRLVGMGTVIVALLLGGALSLMTISTAWLFYRPLIAVPLIAISVALLVLLFRRAREEPLPAKTTPPPLPPR